MAILNTAGQEISSGDKEKVLTLKGIGQMQFELIFDDGSSTFPVIAIFQLVANKDGKMGYQLIGALRLPAQSKIQTTTPPTPVPITDPNTLQQIANSALSFFFSTLAAPAVEQNKPETPEENTSGFRVVK